MDRGAKLTAAVLPIVLAAFALPAEAQSDVVVDSVHVWPARPAIGEWVTFSCWVRNAGNGWTPSGTVIGVGYFVDGRGATWGSVSNRLGPGQRAYIETQGGAWVANGAGSRNITALVDDVNRFWESNENNNARSKGFTVSGDVFGMNIDPANPSAYPSVEDLKGIGVRCVRIEFKADAGFGFYDSVIPYYANAGIKILLLVGYAAVPGKPWSSDASDWEWWDYIYNRFGEGVRQIASRYRDQVHAYQVWNEPDLFAPWDPGYDPGVRPHVYAEMLRIAHDNIRPYSNRYIITGGLASGQTSYLSQVRAAMGGGLWYVNAVAVHPYVQRPWGWWPYSSWGAGSMPELLDRYLAFGLPVWVTEIGTAEDWMQADYLEQTYRMIVDWYAGRVQEVFWFCYTDGMVPGYGLLDGWGNRKASWYKYQWIASTW